MKVEVNWLQQAQHMEAINEEGGKIRIDGHTNIGGIEGGMAPMQLLLAAIAGCSTIDVLNILEKQRQVPRSLKVEVNGDKQPTGKGYSEFKTIHLHFILTGELDPKKVQRALDLSISKYCSVSKALEKTSEITYNFTLNEE